MSLDYKREIAEQVSDYIDEAVELAKELIEIPTVNPPGDEYEECASFLVSRAREYGLETLTIRVPEEQLPSLTLWGSTLPRVNVLARWGAGDGPKINVHCHYDVVPPGKGWSVEPFKGVIREGRLYGRGASDMKGALAASLVVAKALKDLKIKPWGHLILSFTPDEETGGRAGAEFLLTNGYLKPDMTIIPEPSEVYNIWNAHKGAVWMEVILHGKAAHASRPKEGINAFYAMIHVASTLMKNREKLESITSAYRSIWGAEKPTINIGGICSSGGAVNVVPERARFTIDRRLIPEESMEEVEDELRKVIEDSAKEINVDVEVRTLLRAEASSTPKNAFICEVLSRNVEMVLGKPPTFTLCPGVLDMRHFVRAGIDCVSYGPGLMKTAHAIDEYINIEDISTYMKVLALTVYDVLAQFSPY